VSQRFDWYEFVGGPDHGKRWAPPPSWNTSMTLNVFGTNADGTPRPVGFYRAGKGAMRGKMVYHAGGEVYSSPERPS
jgi:hypothetical protein